MTNKEFMYSIVDQRGNAPVDHEVPAEIRIPDVHETRETWGLRVYEWIKTPEGQRALERRESRARAETGERDDKAILAAGVPPHFAKKLKTELNDTEPMVIVKESAATMLLVLAGGTGTGKSLAACWALSQEIACRPGLYVSAPALARWKRYEQDEMDRLLLCPGVLVVDDVGGEFNDANGNFLTIFEEVVNARCLAERRTIVTTNLSADAFRQRYHDRIASRVSEFGAFFEFTGSDLRRG